MTINIRTENASKSWNTSGYEFKHEVTKWEDTIEMCMLRIQLNTSERIILRNISPGGKPPKLQLEQVWVLDFMFNEELRKCKHLHRITVPYREGKILYSNDVGIMVSPSYSKDVTSSYEFSNVPNIFMRRYMLSSSKKLVCLTYIVDMNIEKVLYSTLELDDIPTL
ncbi:MAG: hypothetical protein KAS32_01845 [Candidatus Peribacteraceae bacterium]|nr:hypothetical protein [Candidatus Peribacteraceae bacterium]